MIIEFAEIDNEFFSVEHIFDSAENESLIFGFKA